MSPSLPLKKCQLDAVSPGYSSLGYLHQFPIDTLKVDRSFVSRMKPNGENSELVRTIVTLGRNLGLDVIAEGVETLQQSTQLRTMGCNYGQGYYFSKPLDSEGATTLIAIAPVWLMHDLPASFNCIPSHPDRRPQTTGKPLALTSDLTSFCRETWEALHYVASSRRL